MSQKLIIHQPTNHYSNKFRYYNIFFDNLINELSKTHDVIVDRYYKDVHKGRVNVQLGWDEIVDINVEMQDCELLIENYDTKETFIFSVSDDLTPVSLNLKNSENVTKIFISQFIRDKIYHHINEESKSKYFPWIYFPSNEYDLDSFYELRKQKTPTNDKMYFRGETTSRTILNHFNLDVLHWGGPIGGFYNYAYEMIDYKIALSIAGRAEMCYRDIECMGMGIPIIRFEYTTELNPPLIPNIHYISVDRPDDLKDWTNLDKNGLPHHAEMITNRYMEIKDDQEFLDFISKNAREYYDSYLSPTSSVKHTINLLGL